MLGYQAALLVVQQKIVENYFIGNHSALKAGAKKGLALFIIC
jgi:hypothetical protein